MKMWCPYTVKLYSAVKTNEISNFQGKQMELENTIQSEVTYT